MKDARLSKSEQVNELLAKGYTLVAVQKAGFSKSAITRAGVTDEAYEVAQASISAEAAASAAANKTDSTVPIVIVLFVMIMVVIGAVVYIKKSRSDGNAGPQAGFENPMYDAQPAYTGNSRGGGGGGGGGGGPAAGYMDVNPSTMNQGNQGGYVQPVQAPAPAASSGYMDVSGSNAQSENFGGFDGGDESDEEEV